MTITKQRVEEIISRIEMYGHGAGYTADEVYALAVLALNLSNIANLKRYELDMDGCDSFGQDCGADMTEDPDGDYQRCITYTQADESGASLRAVGFVRVKELPPRKSWAESSVALRSKRDPVGNGGVPRVLWEIRRMSTTGIRIKGE